MRITVPLLGYWRNRELKLRCWKAESGRLKEKIAQVCNGFQGWRRDWSGKLGAGPL